MIDKLLICTDLDRTLIPNGDQLESPDARDMFNKIVSRPDVTLAFVSGRNRQLVLEVINKFDLPFPDFVISDVGTSIYSVSNKAKDWSLWASWHEEISTFWHGRSHDELVSLLEPLSVLSLQESNKQSTYKLSFYVMPKFLDNKLINKIENALKKEMIEASVIWSINETTNTGLVDILPKNATKLNAIKFLMARKGYDIRNTMFAGDSGNDLDVFISDIKSVCVNNATDDVKKLAVMKNIETGMSDCFYLAKGGFNNLNGNYSAGIIEGLYYYYTEFIVSL